MDAQFYQGQHQEHFKRTMSTGFWNYGGKKFDHGNNAPEAHETVSTTTSTVSRKGQALAQALDQVRYERTGRLRTAQSNQSNRRPATGQDPKTMTSFGRFNYKTPTTMKLDMTPYEKVFCYDRKQHFQAKDAMIDANQTILPAQAPKDPGYHELNKRSTVMHDLRSKEIRDNQNRLIIKVDESHGLKNAAVIGQMTHGGASQFHSGPFRNSALYKGFKFD